MTVSCAPVRVVSTTAYRGETLDRVLAQIAADTDVTWVELAVGAHPVADPVEVLASWGERFSYLAHHGAPILPGGDLRPQVLRPETAAATLSHLGIERCTLHPLVRRHCASEQNFWDWAWRWWEALAGHGIAVRLETMYEPRDRDELRRSGGYHLDSPEAVWRFSDAAVARGWDIPLLVDLSHLHIGYHGGTWGDAAVARLLASGLSDHLHVSSNDGRRDQHVSVPPGHLIDRWAHAHRDRFAYVVDEARARRPRLPPIPSPSPDFYNT